MKKPPRGGELLSAIYRKGNNPQSSFGFNKTSGTKVAARKSLDAPAAVAH